MKKKTIALIILCILLNATYFYNKNNVVTSEFSENIEKLDEEDYNYISEEEKFIEIVVKIETQKEYTHKVKKGTTLKDVIDMTDGITENADLSGLDLSKELDADTIIEIPILGNTLININTANKDKLDSLPEIGEVLSERIIDYRENVAKFKDISDIKNVEGIGDKTYEKIKDLITIN